MLRILCVAICAFMLTACGVSAEPAASVPADFSAIYTYDRGPLPPPSGYTLQITISASGAATAELATQGNDGKTEIWTESFTVPPDKLLAAHNVLLQNFAYTREWKNSDDAPVGGPTQMAEVQANGNENVVPAFAEGDQAANAVAVFGALRALGADAEAKLMAQYEAWAQRQ
jgi:hypothetical protein